MIQEHLTPISAVVTPDFDVYSSFRQQILEAPEHLKDFIKHPDEKIKKEFLSKQLNYYVTNQINGMIEGLIQWEKAAYNEDINSSNPEEKCVLAVVQLLNKYLSSHAENQVCFYVIQAKMNVWNLRVLRGEMYQLMIKQWNKCPQPWQNDFRCELNSLDD